MKINEIPEKIYLAYETDNENYSDHIFMDYMWHRYPFYEKTMQNVEYIRTETFIGKAFNFLIERYENKGVIRLEDINDFKEFMEEQQ